MKIDWDEIQLLLDVSEKLRGHPNLKPLLDEASKELAAILAEATAPPPAQVPAAPVAAALPRRVVGAAPEGESDGA